MKKFINTFGMVFLTLFSFGQNVIQAEYFIDTDNGFGKNKLLSLPASPDSVFNFTADLTGLSTGFHKLYIRIKDSNGKWSTTSRRNLEVLKVPNSNYVAAVEYFIQTDPGYGYGLHLGFSSVADTVTHSYNIPFPCLNADSTYNIYLRVQDAQGKWSLTSLPKSFKMRDGATVTNVKSGLWSDAATWSSNMIPDANTAIVLNHDITVDINATCKSLITLCHNVNVNTSHTLIVTGH